MSNLNEINDIIKLNGLIYVNTCECDRFVRDIVTLHIKNRPIYTWNLASGIVKMRDIEYQSLSSHIFVNNPASIDALFDKINKNINNVFECDKILKPGPIYIISDIESLTVKEMCKLHHFMYPASAAKIVVLLVGSNINMPDSITNDCVNITYDKMTRKEIETMITDRIIPISEMYNKDIDNGEITDEKIIIEDSACDMANRCKGLTEEQIILISSYCVSKHSKLSCELLRDAREKILPTF